MIFELHFVESNMSWWNSTIVGHFYLIVLYINCYISRTHYSLMMIKKQKTEMFRCVQKFTFVVMHSRQRE